MDDPEYDQLAASYVRTKLSYDAAYREYLRPEVPYGGLPLELAVKARRQMHLAKTDLRLWLGRRQQRHGPLDITEGDDD